LLITCLLVLNDDEVLELFVMGARRLVFEPSQRFDRITGRRDVKRETKTHSCFT